MTDKLELLIGELKGYAEARFDAQDKRLDEIATQTTKTNGRVTTLEMERERAAGAKDATVQVKVTQAERSGRVQWWVGTLIAGAGVAAGVVATIAAMH